MNFHPPVSLCPSCRCRRRGEGCELCGWNTPIKRPTWRDERAEAMRSIAGGITPVSHAGGVYRELGSETMLAIEGIE